MTTHGTAFVTLVSRTGRVDNTQVTCELSKQPDQGWLEPSIVGLQTRTN